MSEFIQYTLQGLAAGGFYALSALGLAVIFGVLGVVNFSHGACYMLGAVLSAVLLGELHVGFWPALVVVHKIDEAVDHAGPTAGLEMQPFHGTGIRLPAGA